MFKKYWYILSCNLEISDDTDEDNIPYVFNKLAEN